MFERTRVLHGVLFGAVLSGAAIFGCGETYGESNNPPPSGGSDAGPSQGSDSAVTGDGAATCAAPKTVCPNGACIDPRVDHDNCGGCGNACTAEQKCGSSSCFTPGKALTFAIRKIFLGDTDRALNKSPEAWRQIGTNIDGLVSSVNDSASPSLAPLCQRLAGAQPNIHDDGDNGIDNAFGKAVIPLLMSVSAEKDLTAYAHSTLESGSRTTLITIAGWNPGISDVADLSGSVAMAEQTDVAVNWKGDDTRPVLEATSSAFDKGSISSYVFDSGELSKPTGFTLLLKLGPIEVQINKLRVRMTMSPDGTSAILGTLSGVLVTEELLKTIRTASEVANPPLCGSAVIDSVLDPLRASSDILPTATQDPTQACSALSIGLGFEATRVEPGNTTPHTVPVSPCPK